MTKRSQEKIKLPNDSSHIEGISFFKELYEILLSSRSGQSALSLEDLSGEAKANSYSELGQETSKCFNIFNDSNFKWFEQKLIC